MNTSISSIVRKSLSSLVFVAGAFAASAHAQTGTQKVRVAIPFAFQDGSARLTPGVYTMGIETGSIMVVRGAHGSQSALSIVNFGETTKPPATGKVVFHKYGDRYFLSEVWAAGSSTHLQCPRSKAEKNLQKELQLAGNIQDANGTEVALLELPN